MAYLVAPDGHLQIDVVEQALESVTYEITHINGNEVQGWTFWMSKPDERIYREVQREPEFPGDKEQWLVKNIRLPKAANGERLSGRVIVCLVVNEDGSVSGVRVRQGINKTLNDEALRVVRSMPHWKPALKDGKPVKCLITIGVPFKGI